MKILARHKWVAHCIITESVDDTKYSEILTSYRRFTATIRGFRAFRIYDGYLRDGLADEIIGCVRALRDRMDRGDERVFYELPKGQYYIRASTKEESKKRNR